MTDTTARLAGFLQTAQADLDFIIRNGEIFLLPATTSLALSVWPQIQDRFQHLRIELLEAPPEVDEQLRAVGLADRELDIKLAAYNNARERAYSTPVPQVPQVPQPRARGWFMPLFRSVLGWTDRILGSLKAVFPRAEAIKEFKEFVEQGVDDAQNLPLEQA